MPGPPGRVLRRSCGHAPSVRRSTFVQGASPLAARTGLADFGCKVIVADGPRAAIEILDGERRIDRLFADLIVPNGMNSVLLARAARERHAGIKLMQSCERLERARRVRRAIDGPTGVG